MGYYINKGTRDTSNRFADFSAILSASTVRDIYDDDNDGFPDGGPLLWLENTAEDAFESGLLAVFPDLAVLRANPCRTCERIVGEFVMAYAARRFPRAYGRDHRVLLDEAQKSVDRIRTGKDRLAAQGALNPPVSAEGTAFSSASDTVQTYDASQSRNFESFLS